MKSKTLVIGCFAVLLLCYSCNLECTGKKIPFGLIYANKNDSLKITFDEKTVIDKVIKEEYTGHFQDKKDQLTTICATKDSIFVNVKVNNRDTSFYLYPKDIKECYVGSDIAGIIKIYYNYELGGFRKYDPKR